jgi:hypothetical protein
MSTDERYPTKYPACIMCGAATGEPCVVISTAHDEHYDQTAGEPRNYPHSARAKPGQPEPRAGFVSVKDEPDYAR